MPDRGRTDATRKKYEPLGDFLRALDPGVNEITLTFDDVADIIEDDLPKSATKHHHTWWANQKYGSRAPHWMAAGFKVAPVRLKERTVRFERIVQGTGITLNDPELQEVITAVNEHAQGRPVGGLQEWRVKQKKLRRAPVRTPFYSGIDTKRDWVHHAGGQDELQFNLGFEDLEEGRKLRQGVAFSLQPTRETPTIDPLIPKIERFNEYLDLFPGTFTGLSMWHYENGKRSANYAVSSIPDERVRPDVFIFIGAQQDADAISLDLILDDFDHLMPLYRYVEGTESFPKVQKARKGFVWTPGNRARVTRTRYERSRRSVDKQLRHNEIQPALFDHLEAIYGADNVSGEQNSGIGTSVDVAVKEGKKFTYYEIKTGLSAQSCIREALGQLLEYAYWPGNQKADRLVIVGEARYDKNAKSYIKRLRDELSLPIEYKRFDMKSRRLV